MNFQIRNQFVTNCGVAWFVSQTTEPPTSFSLYSGAFFSRSLLPLFLLFFFPFFFLFPAQRECKKMSLETEWNERPFLFFNYLLFQKAKEKDFSERKEKIFSFFPFIEKGEEGKPRNEGEIEKRLIQDLISILVGVEGNIISAKEGHLDSVSVSLFSINEEERVIIPHVEFVRRISILGTYYLFVSSFISRFSFSTKSRSSAVLEAYIAAVSNILHEYLTSVAQIESRYKADGMTLHQLWYYVQSFYPILNSLFRLCSSIFRFLGSSSSPLERTASEKSSFILTLLQKEWTKAQGDDQIEQLIRYLATSSSRPYLDILQHWIYHGRLVDVHGEFIVGERKEEKENGDLWKEERGANDGEKVMSNWSARYFLREEKLKKKGGSGDLEEFSCVPFFLSKLENLIFSTGKYLNVLRLCQDPAFLSSLSLSSSPRHLSNIFRSPREKFPSILAGGGFANTIEEGYQHASCLLLKLLLDDLSLRSHINIIQRLFLVQSGDFVAQFLDMAANDFKGNVNTIRPQKFNSLLTFAVRSSLPNNPLTDGVTCHFDTKSSLLAFLNFSQRSVVGSSLPSSDEGKVKLTGLDAFTLDYSVSFPLSIVLHRGAIEQYQLLFRHLFRIRHVERKLTQLWSQIQILPKLVSHTSSSWLTLSRLTHVMIHFVRSLNGYLSLDVIEMQTTKFSPRISEAKTVDEILSAHQTFLDTLIQESMLGRQELFLMLYKIFSVCEVFVAYVSQKTAPIFSAAEDYRTQKNQILRKLSLTVKNPLQRQIQARQVLLQVQNEHTTRLFQDHTFDEKVNKFDSNFSKTLQTFLDLLRTNSDLEKMPNCSHFLFLLDYNDYFRLYL